MKRILQVLCFNLMFLFSLIGFADDSMDNSDKSMNGDTTTMDSSQSGDMGAKADNGDMNAKGDNGDMMKASDGKEGADNGDMDADDADDSDDGGASDDGDDSDDEKAAEGS